MPNVQNTFRWERVNFGLKPTLFIIQVLTLRGEKPGEAAYVIADKQLYSSHYFETSLDLTSRFVAVTIRSNRTFIW